MLKIAWSPSYCHPLPEGHRFPMLKYELIPEQLLYEGTIRDENLFKPSICDAAWINTTHDALYWEKLSALNLSAHEERAMGFPLSKELVQREWEICSGTIQCAEYALESGISLNVAGGTHHAFADRGEGFCLLNAQAIATNYLLKKKNIRRVLIVDLDVHQGNGTAALFRNSEFVFTFSMHGANNYPARKEVSSLDIGLPDRCNDAYYLNALTENLKRILDHHQPEFIFYQSGVDILETDKLGKLSVSRQGCKERDKLVLELCHQHGIPVVICMGGGYSEKITDIVDAHCNTFRLAQEIWF